MRRLSFRKNQHLRHAADFARVYALRCAARGRYLTVFAAPNQNGALRAGLSVSKKNGNAVFRNRLKRLLREAFRLSRHELPAGLDLVLVPVEARDARLTDFQETLVRSVKRLAIQLMSERPESDAGRSDTARSVGQGPYLGVPGSG